MWNQLSIPQIPQINLVIMAKMIIILRESSGCCWLMPVILAIWEAEIGRLVV
jgi:hypothetical protein